MPESRDRIVVGVDGGGTTTKAIIGKHGGMVLGAGEATGGNPLTVGYRAATKAVSLAISRAMTAGGVTTLDFAYIGLAGGSPRVLQRMHDLIVSAGTLPIPRENIVLDHDLRLALLSGDAGSRAVGLVVGTGSAAIGIGDDGEEIICGGWNQCIGETGGYDLGIKAIIAACRSADGRAEPTLLTDVIREHFSIQHMRELSMLMPSFRINVRNVAALAPSVIQVARQGDSAAVEIVERVADETDDLVRAVSERLKRATSPVVVLVGGLLTGDSLLRTLLAERITRWSESHEFVCPIAEPVSAAFKLACSVCLSE